MKFETNTNIITNNNYYLMLKFLADKKPEKYFNLEDLEDFSRSVDKYFDIKDFLKFNEFLTIFDIISMKNNEKNRLQRNNTLDNKLKKYLDAKDNFVTALYNGDMNYLYNGNYTLSEFNIIDNKTMFKAIQDYFMIK